MILVKRRERSSPGRVRPVTRTVSAVLAMVFLIPATACHNYVAVEPGEPERGQSVRVFLNDPVNVQLHQLEVNNATLVEGEVHSWNEESLVLSAFRVEAAGNAEFVGRGETVSLPRESIARIEEKRVATGKSIALAAGVVGVVIVVGIGFLSGGGGNPNRPPPGTPK